MVLFLIIRKKEIDYRSRKKNLSQIKYLRAQRYILTEFIKIKPFIEPRKHGVRREDHAFIR